MMFEEPQFRSKVIPNFWLRAHEARAAFDGFMGNPFSHAMDSGHGVWDYWYAPNVYTYLRTDPRKVLGEALMDDFNQTLNAFADEHLPGVRPLGAWLTLHLAGMRHEIHSDARNGTYAFVYSLTTQPQSFTGGETCLLKSDALDVEPRIDKAFQSFVDVYPPMFGQLVIFDDRIPHFVPPVMGNLNPLEGRLCLTGHFR